MFRRSFFRKFQVGAHVPFDTAYKGSRMKNWPRQHLPKDFRMTMKQKLTLKPLPRDVGKIPRNFVLNVLYHHQPCEVDKLWELCTQDPHTPLDCKRHLRSVLKQCRSEGWVQFAKESVESRSSSVGGLESWMCLLTRERYNEVKDLAMAAEEKEDPTASMRGSSGKETEDFATEFASLGGEEPSFSSARRKDIFAEKEEHLRRLREAVQATSNVVHKYARTEVDYLPYTDLNGKVNFMWWYDVKDVSTEQRAAEALASSVRAVEGGGQRAAMKQLPELSGVKME